MFQIQLVLKTSVSARVPWVRITSLLSNKKNRIIKTPLWNVLVSIIFIWIMSKGFATDNLITKKSKKKVISNEPQGRLISWSPWPPANFQTRYPAFPFVLTILIIVIGQWYLSLLRWPETDFLFKLEWIKFENLFCFFQFYYLPTFKRQSSQYY